MANFYKISLRVDISRVKASDPIQSRGEKHGVDKGDIECWSSTASLNGKIKKKLRKPDICNIIVSAIESRHHWYLELENNIDDIEIF